MQDQTALIPSASTILLRERSNGLQVLLLKKNAKITYGGSWVFPGGRIDNGDIDNINNNATTNASSFNSERNTAIRECCEETGLELDHSKLIPISRWVTPVARSKRFSAVFFVYNSSACTILEQTVTIDHGEIVEAQWIKVQDAIIAHQERRMVLNGPAFVTLIQLAKHDTLGEALHFYQSCGFITYTPKIHVIENGAIGLYQDDDSYDSVGVNTTSHSAGHSDMIESAAVQHRLYMHKNSAWSYVNTGKNEQPV